MEISNYSPGGSVVISEEAISSIATNAAKDVNGVVGFSNKPDDVVSTIKKGSLKVMSPVRVICRVRVFACSDRGSVGFVIRYTSFDL